MKRILALLFAVTVVGALAGCNSTTGPGGSTDANKQEVQNTVSIDPSADPNVAGVFADDEKVEASASGPGGAAILAVIPDSLNLCWYRHLTHTTRTMNATGDTANMTVTLVRHNDGLLVGRLCDDHGHGHGRDKHDQADSVLFRKRFQVTWTRMAVFTKLAASGKPSDSTGDGGHDGEKDADHEEGTRWVLKATTLAHETVDSPVVVNPPVILSVTIAGKDSAGNDVHVTFDDPTLLIDPSTLPRFADGDPVTVTVKTNLPAVQLAFIHFDQGNSDGPKTWRRPLAYNGTDGFTGTFVVKPGHGGGHFQNRRIRQAVWVEVLNQDTLHDTDAPYAADGWGLPYRLRAGHGGGSPLALRLHQ